MTDWQAGKWGWSDRLQSWFVCSFVRLLARSPTRRRDWPLETFTLGELCGRLVRILLLLLVFEISVVGDEDEGSRGQRGQ